MRWSYNRERSRSVAVWLYLVALMIVAMVVVGGATRMTGSGLSITEWRPISGALPPLSAHAWAEEFARYQRIPQFRYVNPTMTLAQFKGIYAWEWTHRLLGRLIGLVFFVPLLVFLALGRIPQRLVWRCWLLFALGGLQGLVGWWMVASGLTKLVYVAPERLATHLGLALALFAFAMWSGWEAWSGKPRPFWGVSPSWRALSIWLVGLVFFQMLLGALVAGNHAGLVDNDWPLMNGRLFPADYRHGGLFATLLHSQAAVQFNHRVVAYAIFLLAGGMALAAARARGLPAEAKLAVGGAFAAVCVQVLLGIVTLMAGAPLWLGVVHQLWAVATLTAALFVAWKVRRS
jgi:cytochrome c oxidase assembly protein subunit 15